MPTVSVARMMEAPTVEVCETKSYDALPLNASRYFAGITGRRILDVGCGTGNLGAALQAQGNACYGVTISPDETAAAGRKMTQVVTADIERVASLPFPERFFDLVIFADVLEHLREPSRALNVVKPYLAPHARAIASIPNVANVAVRLNLLRGQFDYEDQGIMDNTHVRFYTLHTATALLTASGYAVQSVRFTNWNWELPRLIRWLTFGYEWEARERMTRWWPGLFATQFVLYATPSTNEEG